MAILETWVSNPKDPETSLNNSYVWIADRSTVLRNTNGMAFSAGAKTRVSGEIGAGSKQPASREQQPVSRELVMKLGRVAFAKHLASNCILSAFCLVKPFESP